MRHRQHQLPSLQPDEHYKVYQAVPNVCLKCKFMQTLRMENRNHHMKRRKPPKYSTKKNMTNKSFIYHHINNRNQYRQHLTLLIQNISRHNLIPTDIIAIIINFYSILHKLSNHHCYILYECQPSNKLNKYQLSDSMSFIECIDLKTREYITYKPKLKNGKQFQFTQCESSYFRYNNFVFRIGSNKYNGYGNYQNILYNLDTGSITKLPSLKPCIVGRGLCYSDKHGLIAIGGEIKFREHPSNWSSKWDTPKFDQRFFKDVQRLDISENKTGLIWETLPDYTTKKRSNILCVIRANDKHMFICGGISAYDRYYDYYELEAIDEFHAELYNFDNKTWMKLAKHMFSFNHIYGDCIEWKGWNNNMVVAGPTDYLDCDYYDFHKDKWYQFAAKNNDNDRIKLYEMNDISLNAKGDCGVLVAIGSKLNEINVEIYDHRDSKNKWMEFDCISLNSCMVPIII